MELATIYKEADLIQIYQTLHDAGNPTNPRGESTLEIENFTYSVGPFVRFNSFEGRKFNLSYLKREMAWYIKADPFDTSIAEHAAQWGKIVLNGKLNSNYGSYWFGKYGIQRIVMLLQKDPMSRRAVIPMYGTNADHMDLDAKDVPCTICIEFRLREGTLNTRVVMRSQDILWGMANDLPTFSFLQEIVATLLNAQIGTLTVSVGSFHVYMSRINMFHEILTKNNHIPIADKPPLIRRYEAHNIMAKSINPTFEFSKWLLQL
jgi:thymidylate synthase